MWECCAKPDVMSACLIRLTARSPLPSRIPTLFTSAGCFAGLCTSRSNLGRKKKDPETDATDPKPTMPIKVLNVAEKNDAAKNIAQLLSRGTARRVINNSFLARPRGDHRVYGGDTFFSSTVVLVTISHILQPPSRVRAQLRVKPVTLF